MYKDATIVGPYRYSLTREWDASKPSVVFIMPNPSTADDDEDDNTVKRCVGFAKKWGFGSLEVVNLFAYRTPNPEKLSQVEDPVGMENRGHILQAIRRATKVVLGWGEKLRSVQQADDMMGVIADFSSTEYYCLGLTNNGQPRHPLRVSYDTQLRRCKVQRGRHGRFITICE